MATAAMTGPWQGEDAVAWSGSGAARQLRRGAGGGDVGLAQS